MRKRLLSLALVCLMLLGLMPLALAEGQEWPEADPGITVTFQDALTDDAHQESEEGTYYAYTGSAVVPEVTVTYTEEDGTSVALEEGTDYTLYLCDEFGVPADEFSATEVAAYTVAAEGIEGTDFEGKYGYASFRIISTQYIPMDDVVISDTAAVYDGTAKAPTVEITYGETVLVEGEDYYLVFVNGETGAVADEAIEVGQYNVIIALSNSEYSGGAWTATFTIVATEEDLPGEEPGEETPPVISPPPFPFTDVEEGTWYYDSVVYAWENRLFDGTSDTTFAPTMSMNRAMMAQVLYNLNDTPDAGPLAFDDTDPDAWYANAVAWTSELEIMNGYGDGNFGPDDLITREQMAVVLYNYCDVMGIELPVVRESEAFTDQDDINDWAAEAVDAMYQAGILSGNNNAFNPQGEASRAEVATMLMNFLEATNDASEENTEEDTEENTEENSEENND